MNNSEKSARIHLRSYRVINADRVWLLRLYKSFRGAAIIFRYLFESLGIAKRCARIYVLCTPVYTHTLVRLYTTRIYSQLYIMRFCERRAYRDKIILLYFREHFSPQTAVSVFLYTVYIYTRVISRDRMRVFPLPRVSFRSDRYPCFSRLTVVLFSSRNLCRYGPEKPMCG